MLDDTQTVPDVETVETEDTSAPLEDITSSTEAKETEIQDQPTDEAATQSEVDYLKVLDGLNLDPAVKEQLKAGHLRQADYTRKTQELAKDRGLVENYKQVQPLLEFLNKNPDLFNEVIQKMQGSQPQGQDEIPQDPKKFADWVKTSTIKEIMAMQSQDADFQSAAKVDPRLDSDSEFGELIAKMVASDSDFRNHQISAVEATKKAVMIFDKYISKSINTAKLSLSNKAKAKKSGSMVSSSPAKVGGGTQPMTIEEAARMAEEELAE